MLYKDAKPSGKDAVERESLTRKKGTRVGISGKKVLTKPDNEPPAPLRTSDRYGKKVDPRVKVKQLGSSPRNPEQKMSAEVDRLVRQMTNIEGGKEHQLKKGSRGLAKNMGDNKNKSFERLSQTNDASAIKNSTERTKAQKGDFPKKVLGFKSKSYISEFPERKANGEGVRRAVEEKRKCYLEMTPVEGIELQERKWLESSKKEISKSLSAVGPVTKRSLRRSEIPLLKTRQNFDKRAEVVSLLMRKPLKEDDSNSLVELSQNMKDTSADELIFTSESEATFKPDENSSQLHDSAEAESLKSVARETPDASNYSLPLSYSPLDSDASELSVAEKKSAKASKAKTLDLEKVKTSSFTILQAESGSLSRLESFHQQNLSAKETARAEIVNKASKVTLTTSKASFSSVNSKKNVSASGGDKGNKLNSRKTKRGSSDSQESDFQRQSLKASEGTGKIGRLFPQQNKNGSDDEKSLSSGNAADSWEKIERNVTAKKSLKEEESSKKNKINQNLEEEASAKSSQETAENRFVEMSEDVLGSPRVKTPESYVIESASEYAARENELQEMREEVKLTPRELASLVVTGTALNFDDIEMFEKPREVNKIKLEIKIDVPSEEDVTDSETVEGESSGNTSRASLDWLLMNKKQDRETFPRDYSASKEKLDSWKLLTEEFKTGDWKCNDKVLQNAHQILSSVKRRPRVTKTMLNMAGTEKEKGRKPEDRWSFSGDPYNCSVFFQNGKKREAVSCTKVRSGLTRSCNRDEKIFDDQTCLKLRRRNSEPYSLRGFIWKHADITSPKSLKPSVSSVASSLRHLNTDDLDDFIFWEAVPQKLTTCWEMSLYHFKRPWSVLSFSVFKDNRRSNTPGLILDTLRSGGMPTLRPPLLYRSDEVNCRTGNIFDIEPSISQKNIDIRNWLAALNFTTPIPQAPDPVSENTLTAPPTLDTKKQITPKRRNVMPQLKVPEKASQKKLYSRVKDHKFDKWDIRDMEDLKELIRKESGSYVTKDQYVLSELSSFRPTAITNTCTYTSTSEKCIVMEAEDQERRKEARLVKSVETSCQAEPSETQQQLKLKESPDLSCSSLKSDAANLPPEVNIWKYLFLFTLMFIIFYYSLGSNFVVRF